MDRKLQTGTVHNGTTTSKPTRDKVQPVDSGQQRAVLSHIRKQGPKGATDNEIQKALNMRGDTERPRRRELELAGFITGSVHRRDGCNVWIYSKPIKCDSLLEGTDKRMDATEQGRQRRESQRQQVEQDRSELQRLEAGYGEKLDSLSTDEMNALLNTLSDDRREVIAARIDKFGRTKRFVRPQLH